MAEATRIELSITRAYLDRRCEQCGELRRGIASCNVLEDAPAQIPTHLALNSGPHAVPRIEPRILLNRSKHGQPDPVVAAGRFREGDIVAGRGLEKVVEEVFARLVPVSA